MYLSIAVICSLALILFLLARDELTKRNYKLCERNFYNWQNIASFMIFGLVMGVRYNYGADNIMYIDSYNQLLNQGTFMRNNYEWGFNRIMEAFVAVDAHFSLFIGFWASFQIFFIYYCLRKNIYLLPFVALFLVLGPPFTTISNLMRQCAAECIFFYLIEYIADKKVVHYIIGVLICALIHKSAIILLPLYWLCQKPKLPSNPMILAAIVVICTLIGLAPTWVNSFTRLEKMLAFLDYDIYAENINTIVDEANLNMAWGPSRAGKWLLDLFSILIAPKAMKYLKMGKQFKIYFFLYFFGVCLYNLLANTSQIFFRPIYYLLDLRIFIVPISLYYLYKCRKSIAFLGYSILSFYLTIYLSIKPYIDGVGDRSYEVYKFYFLQ